MTIINDFYLSISVLSVLGLVGGIFGIFGGITWFIMSARRNKPMEGVFAFLLIVLGAALLVFTVTETNDARASIVHTLKEAGYEIIDGFPEDVGSSFVVEKDGEIQYCLTGYTFDGGNSVRIECKG